MFWQKKNIFTNGLWIFVRNVTTPKYEWEITRGTLQIRIWFVRQWSNPSLEQTNSCFYYYFQSYFGVVSHWIRIEILSSACYWMQRFWLKFLKISTSSRGGHPLQTWLFCLNTPLSSAFQKIFQCNTVCCCMKSAKIGQHYFSRQFHNFPLLALSPPWLQSKSVNIHFSTVTLWEEIYQKHLLS